MGGNESKPAPAAASSSGVALEDARLRKLESISFRAAGPNDGSLRFNLTTADISSLADQLIQVSKDTMDQVAAVPAEDASFEKVIAPIARDEARWATFDCMVTFPAYVSPDKDVRKASTDCDKRLKEFQIELSMREDVYKSVMAFKTRGEKLDAEDQRFVDKLIQSFERNGLNLSAEKREQLKTLKKRLSELCIQYNQNLNEDVTSLTFTAEELEGMPEDYLAGLKREGDKYVVTLKYPDLIPLMRRAKREETRRKMDTANSSKCQAANTPLIEEAIRIRHQIACLFEGRYPTHADYVLEIRMAKDPKSVLKFLNELRDKLVPGAQVELKKLEALKAADQKAAGSPAADSAIRPYDFMYYHTQLLEREYDVNEEAAKVYFPLQRVTEGMFAIYQKLLGLVFSEVPLESSPNGKSLIWAPDVKLFNVHDRATGGFLGQFYLDLHPRDGKFGHAAVFPLRKGLRLPDGSYQTPVAAMVANFSKPGEGKPSLLKHNEVVTFFHEFGHVMHNICTEARYSRMSGTAVERDFVECPSQMLENWCWEEESLRAMSSHYETGAPLPDELLGRMIAAKNADAGLLTLRQVFFGLFDMAIHTRDSADTAALWAELRKEVTLIEHTPGTNPAASFGHMMSGYDAGYYGYLWSQVYSADMFYSRFRKEGIMNPAVGSDYRRVVLAPGGSRDSGEVVHSFLGRDPTPDAFLASLGLARPRGLLGLPLDAVQVALGAAAVVLAGAAALLIFGSFGGPRRAAAEPDAASSSDRDAGRRRRGRSD
eukprot:tig00000989_g6081.t1